jgi:YD repeat-containing protein
VVENADASGSAMTTAYTANALNQYTAIDGFVPSLYDSNGNLTRVQTSATTPIWTYAYDAQNRLVSGSATDGPTFTFACDAKNRCIARTINATMQGSGTCSNSKCPSGNLRSPLPMHLFTRWWKRLIRL